MEANKFANKPNNILGFIKQAVGPKNSKLSWKLCKTSAQPTLEHPDACALEIVSYEEPYLKKPTLQKQRYFCIAYRMLPTY